MWRTSTDRGRGLALLALVAAAACGERPHDSADDVLRLVGDGGSCGLTATLGVSSQVVDPGVDVRISWEDLTLDLLGLPLAEVQQLRLWAFSGLGEAELAAGLVAGSIEQSSVLTQYTCQPQAQACSFSELEVFGHDYDVRDDFGVLDATWLITLHGADRRGLQAVGFIQPGSGELASLDDQSGSMSLELTLAPALAVAQGSGPSLDWSGLDTDAQGHPLSAYRLDMLGLFHLPVAIDQLEATLREQGLADASAWWLDVAGRDDASLEELQGEQGFAGIDDQGTWLLALFESSGVSPLPRVLVVLAPQ